MYVRNKKALVIFSKAPELAHRAPDEPYAGLPWTDLDALYSAMFDDVLETALTLPSIDVYILKNDPEFSNEFLIRLNPKVQILEHPNTALHERVHYAFETLFSLKYEQVVLLLEPNPLMTKADLRNTFELLHYDDDSVVVGQNSNGKCFLLALKSDHSDLFEAMGDTDVFSNEQCFFERICERELMVFPIPPKYPLDTGSSLHRLKVELEELAGGNGFSQHTRTMFRSIDKKYRLRKFR
ncbi:MAG: DUF2064 domain-containing protein [Ignavibacteriae bacterium]|nr:DUF2064 domain-containing protein [Ignavibacteriota bacterium]